MNGSRRSRPGGRWVFRTCNAIEDCCGPAARTPAVLRVLSRSIHDPRNSYRLPTITARRIPGRSRCFRGVRSRHVIGVDATYVIGNVMWARAVRFTTSPSGSRFAASVHGRRRRDVLVLILLMLETWRILREDEFACWREVRGWWRFRAVRPKGSLIPRASFVQLSSNLEASRRIFQ